MMACIFSTTTAHIVCDMNQSIDVGGACCLFSLSLGQRRPPDERYQATTLKKDNRPSLPKGIFQCTRASPFAPPPAFPCIHTCRTEKSFYCMCLIGCNKMLICLHNMHVTKF